MREVGNIHKTKRCATALDGVRCTENRINFFDIGAVIQCQQAGFHDAQSLETFLEENIVKLRKIDGHLVYSLKHAFVFMHPVQSRTRRRVLINCSGSNGLTIQPVAPAALPIIFFSVLDSVVRIRIGLNL